MAGKAVFLEKLLKIFDFDAFTVNFGIEPDGLNHVAVVVADAGGVKDSSDGWRFFLLDPTFNATFEENGHMITVNELLRRSQLGLINEGVVNQRALSHLEYIVPRENANGDRCQTKLGDLGADVLCRNRT